ncbi:MAG: hypothetical protein IIT46_00145 [Lachnospiraceae bacterium]|nr:hypothetical protein [Lachnospiraceae bacterium]
MYKRQELDEALVNDLKFKAENPPVKSDKYLKALFFTSILDDFENGYHYCDTVEDAGLYYPLENSKILK